MLAIVRYCVNSIVVILMISLMFKVSLPITIGNILRLIIISIVCSWFDKEVFNDKVS
jgi:hypothetical protein